MGDDDRLADRMALQELKARYFRLMDTKQWAAWRELFTDDLIFYNDDAPVPTSNEPMTTGGDDFVEMVSKTLTGAVTIHQGHMPEIELIDDRHARGVWAMFDWVDSPGASPGMQGFGHYHERYEKGDDGRWRIAEIRLTRLRTDLAGPVRDDAARPAAPAWTRPAAANA